MKTRTAAVALLLALPTVAIAADTAPRSVQLKSGERVTGEVVTWTESAITIKSATVGTVTISSSNVQDVIGPDGKPETYVPVPVTGLFGTDFLAGWDKQFEFGFTGTAGTTDSTAINAQFNAANDNASYRSTFGAWFFYAADNDTTSRNQTRVFGTYDKKIDGGPWFVFGRAQYDNDSLMIWENRASFFAGPGYEFVKKADYELIGRVGVGYTHEFGGNVPEGYDDSRFEALVGLDGKWVVDPNQTVVYSIYYFPAIDDFAYGRVVSTVAYQADLNKSKGLALRAGVEHTYDFVSAGEDEHNNWKYFTNLVLKL